MIRNDRLIKKKIYKYMITGVRYGYKEHENKDIDICLSKTDEKYYLRIRDDGVPFDPTSYQANEKDPFDFDIGGMGLVMTAQTVSEWEYRREDDRNVLVMKLKHFGAVLS